MLICKVLKDLADRRFHWFLAVVVMRAGRKVKHFHEVFLAENGRGGAGIASQFGGALSARRQREVRLTRGRSEHPFQYLFRGRPRRIGSGKILSKLSRRLGRIPAQQRLRRSSKKLSVRILAGLLGGRFPGGQRPVLRMLLILV